MTSPLNQIFYGPPGTGKTYNVSLEAEKIVNFNVSSRVGSLDLIDKFDRLCWLGH